MITRRTDNRPNGSLLSSSPHRYSCRAFAERPGKRQAGAGRRMAMGKRLLAATLGAALTGGLAALPAAAQSVKIGIILTYSGPAASLGDQIDKGMSLYVKEHQSELPTG